MCVIFMCVWVVHVCVLYMCVSVCVLCMFELVHMCNTNRNG